MDIYADLFISKKVPLVLATVPEALIENASSQKETRLEVARRVEAAGGEIIAHNGTPLTQDGFEDYSTMYSFFVRTKQLFNYYDFDVNGIILSGGTGQVIGAEESERWASSIYSYSDLYGVQYDNDVIACDSVYFHGRGGLGNYQNDLDAIKAEIDKTIAEKSWRVFYFHDSNEITEEVLGQVLDYVNSKSESELEVVTYKEMYEKNAAKESEIMNTNTTYYVSSTGTSTAGTSANDPMSYETAQSKTYISGDTILFKKGDTFYGTFNPTIAKTNDKVTTISSYGEGEMPNIVGYKIADSENSWQMHVEGLYKIYLKGTNYFSGLMTIDDNSANVGYMEDKNGTKYYSKKGSLSELSEQYDFYCDGSYLYIKSDENPYNKLGELKLATKTNLLIMKSNMKIENIRFSGTGAHGLVNSDSTIDNVEISNNVIEDIGGSYLKGTTRYGNGIEFYGTDASNIVVKNNIIRNVYDVGFTMQGTRGSGTNVVVEDNIFVSNTQDSEIWESGNATGIHSYEFTDNISINQGRGWGYDARPDKYAAAHILFWQYLLEDTNIYFHHNIVYNPRRLYFAEQTNGTNIYFKEKDYIKSDYNTYLCTDETTIFRDSYTIAEKDDFIADYKNDANSTFSLIEVDENIVQTAVTSDAIKTIRKIFKEEEEETDTEKDKDLDTEEDKDLENDKKTEEENSKENNTETSEEADTEKNEGTTQSTALEKGTQFTDATTNAVYKVITTGANGTVEYEECTKQNAKTVTIPATVTVGDATYKVTSVAAKALKGNKTVTKVIIGKNVKTIGNEAFNGCKKLMSLTLGKNVTTIGKKAFYKCTALTKITIPSKVKKIGAYAFYGCKKLKNLTIKSKYLTTKRVGKKAFSGIYKKAKIKVPSSKKKAYKKMLRKRGISSKATIK